MNKISVIQRVMMVGFVVVLAALVVGQSAARRPADAMSQPIFATIDLERVFNESNERAEAEVELEQQADSYQVKVDGLRSEAELLRQDLDLLVPGTPQFKKAEKRWVEAVLNYRTFAEFSKAKLESMRTSARKRIYLRIMEGAKTYAIANGIGLVLTDDSANALHDGNDRQVIQQMSLRRVVYTDRAYDITRDLVQWLNAERD